VRRTAIQRIRHTRALRLTSRIATVLRLSTWSDTYCHNHRPLRPQRLSTSYQATSTTATQLAFIIHHGTYQAPPPNHPCPRPPRSGQLPIHNRSPRLHTHHHLTHQMRRHLRQGIRCVHGRKCINPSEYLYVRADQYDRIVADWVICTRERRRSSLCSRFALKTSVLDVRFAGVGKRKQKRLGMRWRGGGGFKVEKGYECDRRRKTMCMEGNAISTCTTSRIEPTARREEI